MKIFKAKLLPQLVGIVGGAIWILGLVLLANRVNQTTSHIVIIIGFLVLGCAGLPIIGRRSYSFGFLEIKGVLGIIYGAMVILIGWGLAVLFAFRFFG